MPSFKEYIRTNRPAVFDWSVILISFTLGFLFPTSTDFIRSGFFYNLLLAGVGCYIAGAVLKHLPLSIRLTANRQPDKTTGYRIFLIFGHWLIFFLLFILLETPIRRILQFPLKPGGKNYSPVFMAAATFCAALVTWLVYRSKTKLKTVKSYSPQYLLNRELVADLLLIAGVAVLNFFIWEKGVMEMLSRSRTDTIGDIWFLFLFFSILFIACYLPLRYLFFIEDKPGSNTKRLLYIFGFMLLRALFEMLAI